jgi:hypothetical protein
VLVVVVVVVVVEKCDSASTCGVISSTRNLDFNSDKRASSFSFPVKAIAIVVVLDDAQTHRRRRKRTRTHTLEKRRQHRARRVSREYASRRGGGGGGWRTAIARRTVLPRIVQVVVKSDSFHDQQRVGLCSHKETPPPKEE